MKIMDYDPNLTNSGRMATQTVTLTFGQWEYRKEITVDVGGNCTGLEVIDCAVGRAYDKLPRKGVYLSDDDYAYITMDNEDGTESLETEDEDGRHEDWLKDMLVEAKIIDIKPSE